jgi:hypothetical protein
MFLDFKLIRSIDKDGEKGQSQACTVPPKKVCYLKFLVNVGWIFSLLFFFFFTIIIFYLPLWSGFYNLFFSFSDM